MTFVVQEADNLRVANGAGAVVTQCVERKGLAGIPFPAALVAGIPGWVQEHNRVRTVNSEVDGSDTGHRRSHQGQ